MPENFNAQSDKANNKKNIWIIIGLGMISFGTIITELVLTKFIAYKLYHHFAYAIISLIMFSFGLAGVSVFLYKSKFGEDNNSHWLNSAQACFHSAWLQLVCLLIYCILIIDPAYTTSSIFSASIMLPLCFVLFAIPFFFAGLAINQTFSASKLSVSILYFWDLLFAALGAISTPFLLESLGGYGTILVGSIASVIASLAYIKASKTAFPKIAITQMVFFSLIAILFLAFPKFMISTLGYDICSLKDPAMRTDFNRYSGLARTYWNAIARIDISKTLRDNELFLLTWGMSKTQTPKSLQGRYILVDGAAATRQLLITGSIENANYVGDTIFSLPYIVNPNCQKALVIGGGGGIDILIAKYYKIPVLDVCEFNPSLFKFLTGKADDPERSAYYPSLISNLTTKVTILNKEGRHFVSTAKLASYDVIQMSGVDTLTAISGGGLSLSENYLYTIDAVKDYMRLLKPNGVLSQTHWRQRPPNCALRQFVTYLEYLRSIGIANPSKNIMVIGGSYTEIIVKLKPITIDEEQRIVTWAKKCAYDIIFDPLNSQSPETNPQDKIFQDIANAQSIEAQKNIIDNYQFAISPVTDDCPYFYRTFKSSTPEKKILRSSFHVEDASHAGILLIGIFGALLLMFLPALKLTKSDFSIQIIFCGIFFAISGFAFLFLETSIMQAFGIFVGGPLYSMCTVLVAVLAGYALGSFFVGKITPTRTKFILLGILLFSFFGCSYLWLHKFISLCMPLDLGNRLIIAALITVILAVPTGMLVPSAAQLVRERYGRIIAWMLGINAAFNVIGGLSFIPISQVYGINFALLIAGIAYLIAGLFFGIVCLPGLQIKN